MKYGPYVFIVGPSEILLSLHKRDRNIYFILVISLEIKITILGA